MADRTVTIDRAYFDALLHRAEFHATECLQDKSSVVVPKTVHEELLRDSREYHSLRQSLVDGGVSLPTLDILVRGGELSLCESGPAQDDLTENINLLEYPSANALKISPGPNRRSYEPTEDVQRPNSSKSVSTGTEMYEGSAMPQRKGARQDHTLLLSNLPDSTTHKDITSIIRGGRLVDIWLRKSERSASVTFAEGAADFLAYAKRSDIYIQSKRIEVSWSDRQFAIPTHLNTRLVNGHSRNLVIRGAFGKITDERVREDLDHIHNLVIVATVWKSHDVYISTNSVNNATFARNCLMSRQQYKGLKIDWYPDECADELPKPPTKPAPSERRASAATSRPKMPVANRFDLLSLEDGHASADSGADDAEDDHDKARIGLASAGRAGKSMIAV